MGRTRDTILAAGEGDVAARSQLMAMIYDDVLRSARWVRNILYGSPSGVTRPTVLANMCSERLMRLPGRRIARFQSREELTTYATAILKNEVKQIIRKRRRQSEWPRNTVLEAPAAPDSLAAREQRDRNFAAFDRAVKYCGEETGGIALLLSGRCTVEEVARETGWSVRTVHRKKKEILGLVRVFLAEDP